MEGVRRMTAHPLLPLCKSYNICFTNFLEISRFFFFFYRYCWARWWLCCNLGVGSRWNRCSTANSWNIRQGESPSLQQSRQQIWCGWWRWPRRFVDASPWRRICASSSFFRKNLFLFVIWFVCKYIDNHFVLPLMQSHQCHSKGTSDFVFLGSSSVLATTGQSSESRNVVLWDTLMPQRKAVIHCKYFFIYLYLFAEFNIVLISLFFLAFVCHENGGTSLLYAAQHQLLISAGRKGVVCLWDLRQRTLRHKFTAHESSVAVKCMALDPNEEFFATGSADGDIKVFFLSFRDFLLF